MEEEERQSRMAQMKEVTCSLEEMRANLALIKQLEEEEREVRVRAWNEENKMVYLFHSPLLFFSSNMFV